VTCVFGAAVASGRTGVWGLDLTRRYG
jgi:hypothetical protein